MLIHRLKVAGLLSFGPEGIDLPLKPLNVLIGPNGSGKSNLLEVLALLRASPHDLPAPIKAMGGVREWLWKAPTVPALTSAVSVATIDAVIDSRCRYATSWKSLGMENALRLQTNESNMNVRSEAFRTRSSSIAISGESRSSLTGKFEGFDGRA